MALIVIWNGVGELAGVFAHFRTRPHNGHLAAQHIEDLRQFVQTRPSQKAAEARNSKVSRACPIASGLSGHGAEFANPEYSSVASDAILTEEHRRSGIRVNRKCDNRYERE